MAKETFERAKPHVNVGTVSPSSRSAGASQGFRVRSALLAAGVSAIGARQFANGQVVTNPGDRQRLAEVMHAAVGRHEITGALVKIN